jgi:hypothetical protein
MSAHHHDCWGSFVARNRQVPFDFVSSSALRCAYLPPSHHCNKRNGAIADSAAVRTATRTGFGDDFCHALYQRGGGRGRSYCRDVRRGELSNWARYAMWSAGRVTLTPSTCCPHAPTAADSLPRACPRYPAAHPTWPTCHPVARMRRAVRMPLTYAVRPPRRLSRWPKATWRVVRAPMRPHHFSPRRSLDSSFR